MAKGVWRQRGRRIWAAIFASAEERMAARVATFHGSVEDIFQRWNELRVNLLRAQNQMLSTPELPASNANYQGAKEAFEKFCRNIKPEEGFFIFARNTTVEARNLNFLANDIRQRLGNDFLKSVRQGHDLRSMEMFDINSIKQLFLRGRGKMLEFQTSLKLLADQSRECAMQMSRSFGNSPEIKELLNRAGQACDVANAVDRQLNERWSAINSILRDIGDEIDPQRIKDALRRVDEHLREIALSTKFLEKTSRDTSDAVNNFLQHRLFRGMPISGGASFLNGTEEKEARQHPLSAGEVARNALEKGTELGGRALDVVDVADCVETYGACYIINPVADRAVDNVVVPIAETLVAPVVGTSIAAGRKVEEVIAPVVSKGAELANEYVVKPTVDKLDKAFQEPARIASEVGKTTLWGAPKPW
ncbi:MAG: hypothetical protein R3F23_04510 [Verrucomicrobiia bacterium]